MSQHPQYGSPAYYVAPNALAVWALVLGIIALVLSPFIIGGVIGMVALVLGVIAAARPSRKGLAVTGIVLASLAIAVAGMVGLFTYKIYRIASSHVVTPYRQAVTDIFTLKIALDSFDHDVGRYPTTAEGLAALQNPPPDAAGKPRGPFLIVIPDDPWGHPYLYVSPGKTDPFDLKSSGPDGIPDTADDITRAP